MSEKVIVTGNPNGQVVSHLGVKVFPGGRFVMDRKNAELYRPDVIILETHVEKLEVPKAKPAETAKEVLAERAAVAESGRIDRGSQQRTEKTGPASKGGA